MYAFSVATALAGIKLDLQLPPENLLIVQPPADKHLGTAAMFHYTWGAIFKDANGKELWQFDKRTYTDASIQTKVTSVRYQACLSERRFALWHACCSLFREVWSSSTSALLVCNDCQATAALGRLNCGPMAVNVQCYGSCCTQSNVLADTSNTVPSTVRAWMEASRWQACLQGAV
jgi:hypothetical protein